MDEFDVIFNTATNPITRYILHSFLNYNIEILQKQYKAFPL